MVIVANSWKTIWVTTHETSNKLQLLWISLALTFKVQSVLLWQQHHCTPVFLKHFSYYGSWLFLSTGDLHAQWQGYFYRIFHLVSSVLTDIQCFSTLLFQKKLFRNCNLKREKQVLKVLCFRKGGLLIYFCPHKRHNSMKHQYKCCQLRNNNKTWKRYYRGSRHY
jgi:hypothetical protein